VVVAEKTFTFMMSAPLLSAAMAEFARELQLLLENDGQPELAAQVQGLRIVDRCRCGADFCATFYSEPRPNGAWASLGRHECLTLNAEEGMIILDLVDRRIVCVEVLDSQDVRKRLHNVLP
jgi:hypothetical protein